MPRTPRRPDEDPRPLTPAEIASTVGDICKRLERVPPDQRKKVLDTVTLLMTATSPASVKMDEPPRPPSWKSRPAPLGAPIR